MSMLSAVYCNLSQYPSVYVFTLPYNNATTNSIEVLADGASAANWHEACDLVFLPTGDHESMGRTTTILHCCSTMEQPMP